MENATENSKTKRVRYCSIPFCENVRGTSDSNISFFRMPEKGTPERKLWTMMLFATPGLKIGPIANLFLVCHLHFKPEDIRTHMVRGERAYKLKPGAMPLPIKKPIHESATENVKIENPVKIVTLVDINQIRNAEDSTAALDTPDDTTPSNDLGESNECVNCVHIDGELQRAKITIGKLLRRVNKLKRLVREVDYEKCELCSKTISENDVSEHSCEEELLPIETVKYETSDAIFSAVENINGSEVSLKNKIEVFSNKSELEELDPDLYFWANEPKTLDSTNVTQSHKFFQCGRCNESFETTQELAIHVKKHAESYYLNFIRLKPEYFECFICKKHTTKSKMAMVKHIRRHRKYSKCEICRKRSLSTHLCGDGADDVQCEYCSKRFKTTVKMQQHLDKVHQNDRRFYGCAKCTKFFATIFFRDCHQAVHSESDEFKCDMCPKIFSKRINLYQHMKTHRIGKSFLCDECGKAFPSARNLELHKKSHSEPTIECPLCPKKFVRECELKRHSTVHSDIKTDYVCAQCGKCLATLTQYKKHKKRHEQTDADRRFACKLCPQKFFLSKELKHHEIKHSGIRQFHCDFCDNSYKYKGDLDKHLRTHLDGKIYECTTCQMRFKYAVELQKHSFEHYKEEKERNQNLNGGETVGERK